MQTTAMLWCYQLDQTIYFVLGLAGDVHPDSIPDEQLCLGSVSTNAQSEEIGRAAQEALDASRRLYAGKRPQTAYRSIYEVKSLKDYEALFAKAIISTILERKQGVFRKIIEVDGLRRELATPGFGDNVEIPDGKLTKPTPRQLGVVIRRALKASS